MNSIRESQWPTGTVTFLFTDIEGSTRLLEQLGAEQYAEVLGDHHRAIREALTAHDGVEVVVTGDAFFCVFASGRGAVAAITEVQQRLTGPIRVRAGLHTGEALLHDGNYVGLDIHHAARVGAAGHGGQTVLTDATVALLDRASVALRDLGEHRLKDLSAPIRLHQLGSGEFPPLKTLRRSNLPVPSTPFLGRHRELAEIAGLARRDDLQLLTLTGPGGTGKTRLALQATAEAADAFPDGSTWLALASLRDATLIATELGQALAVAGDGTPVETLAAALAGKRHLILLDNVEHLLPEAADQIVTLREACPGVTLLVTSRERLQLTGEHVYPVPALDDTDGLELFLVRAAQAGANVEPSETVRELCQRLDRLPLAIELAAARTSLLTPEQLLERLGQRLDILKGARDADPRQQTLRATIQWSHDLLDPNEQRLFRGLSVFRGGCTLDAAQGICDVDLDLLQSLLDKSLVRRRDGPDGHPRYWMLETIRQYAREQLEQADELDDLRGAHADWYSVALEMRADALREEESAARAWVSAEIDNLRAALTTFIDRSLADEATSYAARLCPYFPPVGAHREEVQWAERVLALDPPASSERARIELDAAAALRVMGEKAASRAMYEAAAQTSQSAGDDQALWRAKLQIGRGLLEDGRAADALSLMDDALAHLRRTGSPRQTAGTLYSYAQALAEEGMPERALPLFEEAHEITRTEGLEYGMAVTTQGIGWAALLLGDDARGVALSADSAARFHELGDREGVAYGLENVATTLTRLGHSADAAVLAAVATRTQEELGIPPTQAATEIRELTTALLREDLDADELERLRAHAATLDDAAAIRLALEASGKLAPQQPGERVNREAQR